MKRTVSPQAKEELAGILWDTMMSPAAPEIIDLVKAVDKICEWYESQNTFSDAVQSEDYEPVGPDITPQEAKRMTGQRAKVFNIMLDGEWRTLQNIIDLGVESPPQSVAIYLRSFRELRYGGYKVEKKKMNGTRLFAYRLFI